jgi:hypothetical protein
MFVTVTLTSASPATGPYDLYQNVDGFTVPVATNVSQPAMFGGYTVTVNDLSTIIRVQSVGTCTNFIDLDISGIPSPTPTQTPTPTVTETPTNTPTVTPTITPSPTSAGSGGKLQAENNDFIYTENNEQLLTEQ